VCSSDLAWNGHEKSSADLHVLGCELIDSEHGSGVC
jgi:hypothetical protein